MTILDKKVGWSSSNKLVTGDRFKEVSLQADFPRAETYVLQFNKTKILRVINPAGEKLPVRAEAFITWSVEGNSVTRRVSIANGITIQGVAQAVRVIVKDVTDHPFGTVAPIAQLEYSVSAQVTPGTRGSNKFPPFLVPNDAWRRVLTIGTPSITLPVPQDAGIISFVFEATGVFAGLNKPLIPGTVVAFLQQDTVVVATIIPQSVSEVVPLPPGVDEIRFLFIPAVDPTINQVHFTVLYGIDG